MLPGPADAGGYTPTEMRQKLTTIFLLITVICLGLALLLAPRSAERTAPAEPLLAFPPSEVAAVEASLPDGSRQRLERTAPDRWVLELDSGEAEPVRWPASADRVRAFLRILDRARGVATEQEVSEGAARLAVRSQAGAETTLALPRATLGGRAVVGVTGGGAPDGVYATTDELPRLIGDRGFLPWIDDRAFAGVRGRVVRVEVESGGERLEITREAGAWRIIRPFEAPAEAALVDELVERLRTLPIAEGRVAEVEPPADATTIRLGAEERLARGDGTVDISESVHRMATLGPVGAGGRAPVVLAAGSGDDAEPLGPLTASIDAASLTELVRRPSFYLSRRALRAEPADVRSLAVTPTGAAAVVVERDGSGGWRMADGGAAQGPGVERLVELLTSDAAPVAAWSEAGLPEGATVLATVECRGLGGVTLGTVTLGVAPLPEPGQDRRDQALVVSGNVHRYYAPEAAVEAVRWVAGLRP